jgi:hypothetical protein
MADVHTEVQHSVQKMTKSLKPVRILPMVQAEVVMSSRRVLRRKIVIPVSVIRHDGQEKQLAHTLDMTETSARLGGLSSQLQVGEVIEIQRGALKAKFQVFWMGPLGSAMAGQAGVRSLMPRKDIWGIDLPKDEVDPNVDVAQIRSAVPECPASGPSPGQRRSHTRYECEGSATIKTPDASYTISGSMKDISEGGIYVEIMTPLPVNTQVSLNMSLEGVWIEATGIVRTSYPMVGMGVSFQSVVGTNREKLDVVVERLRRKTSRASIRPVSTHSGSTRRESAHSGSNLPGSNLPEDAAKPGPGLRLDAYSIPVLVQAFRAFANGFDAFKIPHTFGEMDELRRSVDQLQRKLSSMNPQPDSMPPLNAPLPSGKVDDIYIEI